MIRGDFVHLCIHLELQKVQQLLERGRDNLGQLSPDGPHETKPREHVDNRQPVPIPPEPRQVPPLALDQVHLTVPALLEHDAPLLLLVGDVPRDLQHTLLLQKLVQRTAADPDGLLLHVVVGAVST